MIGTLFNLVIWLFIFGIVYFVVLYVIDHVPIPDPPARWIRIAMVIFIAFAAIALLASLAGVDTGVNFPRFIQ